MKNTTPILIISLLLVGFLVSPAFAQEDEILLPDPGLTPSSPFYFLDDVWKSIQLTFAFSGEKKADLRLKFAEEKLAEARVMAEEGNERALEKALVRYEEQIERAQERAAKVGDKRAELSERVANATSRHLEVLEKLREKLGDKAKKALFHAREASDYGQLQALRVLAEDRGERAAELLSNALDRRAKLAEHRANNNDEGAVDEVNRFERFADFAEELRAKFQDNPQLRDRISEHLKKDMPQRQETLRRVLNKVPDNAKPAIQRAIDQFRKIENPRKLEEIKDRLNLKRDEQEKERLDRARDRQSNKEDLRRRDDGKICIQVITHARNPENGNVRRFNTPCDVPDGWRVVKPELQDPQIRRTIAPRTTETPQGVLFSPLRDIIE